MRNNLLESFGLSPKEALVYETILESGRISPLEISTRTGIKRPTVYALGKGLIAKGIIQEDTSGSTTYYYPTPAKGIKNLAHVEQNNFEEKLHLIDALSEHVTKKLTSKTNRVVPKITFIEGEDEVLKFLYKQLPLWIDSLEQSDLTVWGFQDHTFVEHKPYLEWIKHQWKESPKDIEVKLISNDTAIEKKYSKDKLSDRRHIRYWNKSLKFTASQWIEGDYSVMIVTSEKPHYLVQTYDPIYTQNMRELFSNLWKELDDK